MVFTLDLTISTLLWLGLEGTGLIHTLTTPAGLTNAGHLTEQQHWLQDLQLKSGVYSESFRTNRA